MNWYEVRAGNEYGYPKPVDGFGFLKKSYDLTDFCRYCGIGKKLIRQIDLTEYPLAGDWDFFRTNWVADQLFCTVDVARLLIDFGITGARAFADLSGMRADEHVQLDINTVLPPGIVPDQPGVKVRKCPEPPTLRPKEGFVGGPCGRIKVGFVRPVAVRQEVFKESPDLAHLGDWVGAMGSAEQVVVCSEKFVDLYRTRQLRGLDFYKFTLV